VPKRRPSLPRADATRPHDDDPERTIARLKLELLQIRQEADTARAQAEFLEGETLKWQERARQWLQLAIDCRRHARWTKETDEAMIAELLARLRTDER
jgi:hypothetical protein